MMSYSMSLIDLLRPWMTLSDKVVITGMTMDSRRVKKGDVFFACPAFTAKKHGMDYLDNVLQQGAVAVIWEPTTNLPADYYGVNQRADLSTVVPFICFPDLHRYLSDIAARFYAYPEQQLTTIAITGTNGKTSTAYFIAQLLGAQCAIIGTLGIGIYHLAKRYHLQTLVPKRQENYTTPDAISVQQALAIIRDKGLQYVVMEVSSHALAQYRVAAITFDLAIFTNLTQDHLDYHGSMSAYAKAKQRLFNNNTALQTSILNIDDGFGQQLLRYSEQKRHTIYTYSLTNKKADVHTIAWQLSLQGMNLHCHVNNQSLSFSVPVFGQFNISNLLAAISTLVALKWSTTRIIAALKNIQAVPGRMDLVHSSPVVIVDYAHTPDALQQVLKTMMTHQFEKLYCVFGCGGNRDKTKRPLMGKIAAEYADQIMLTNDNPRYENPDAIIADILDGISDKQKVSVIRDRKKAIEQVLSLAQEQEVVLIAGKGHEDYQEIAGNKNHFDDKEVVEAFYRENSRDNN